MKSSVVLHGRSYKPIGSSRIPHSCQSDRLHFCLSKALHFPQRQSSVELGKICEPLLFNFSKRGIQRGDVAQCQSSSGSLTPEIEYQEQHGKRGLIQTRLGYICKGLGIAIALYAWLQIAKGRPGSLFASAFATQSSSQGIKTAGGSAWAGLAAGCLHSLSGPDHLAALTPLTLGRTSVRASLLGAWWGFGHCIGQLILGLLMLLLKERFHNMVPMLDKYSSLTIGLTLLTIGVLGLYETLQEEHSEPSPQQPPLAFSGAAASGTVPVEPTPASLLNAAESDSKREKVKGFSLWTLSTGIVYGLQPDALFVVIPALALPTKLAAAAYMSMFVAGTVAAMGGYTAFIGATSQAMQSRGGWFKVEKLSALASAIAVVMGVIIATGGTISLPFLSHAH